MSKIIQKLKDKFESDDSGAYSESSSLSPENTSGSNTHNSDKYSYDNGSGDKQGFKGNSGSDTHTSTSQTGASDHTGAQYPAHDQSTGSHANRTESTTAPARQTAHSIDTHHSNVATGTSSAGPHSQSQSYPDASGNATSGHNISAQESTSNVNTEEGQIYPGAFAGGRETAESSSANYPGGRVSQATEPGNRAILTSSAAAGGQETTNLKTIPGVDNNATQTNYPSNGQNMSSSDQQSPGYAENTTPSGKHPIEEQAYEDAYEAGNKDLNENSQGGTTHKGGILEKIKSKLHGGKDSKENKDSDKDSSSLASSHSNVSSYGSAYDSDSLR